MRTFCAVAALSIGVAFATGPTHSVWAADTTGISYDSPEAAYKAGQRALKRGDYRAALKPLRDAAEGGVFLAKYFLAELLADRRHVFADPQEAFALYSELIDSNPDVDPFYDYRARFVARAYVMKGRYLSGVLPIDGIELSQAKARRLFGHAASYLDYPDAQFEFARMLLKGRGGARNVRSGKHYLSTLSRKGHAAAQGYLAELFWNGEYVPKRPDYALALSTLAVRNTRRTNQIWLDELHHEISCGVSAQIHEDADQLLERWTKSLPKEQLQPSDPDDAFAISTARWTCGSTTELAAQTDDGAMNETENGEKELWPDQNRLEALHGSMFGFTGETGESRNVLEDVTD